MKTTETKAQIINNIIKQLTRKGIHHTVIKFVRSSVNLLSNEIVLGCV